MKGVAAEDFPAYLGIYCKNLDGYLNNSNVSTHMVAVASGEASIKYGADNLRDINYTNSN